jgi:hypothetical protein
LFLLDEKYAQETQLCQQCLDPITFPKLTAILDSTLITPHLVSFSDKAKLDEFKQMVTLQEADTLVKLTSFVRKVDPSLSDL